MADNGAAIPYRDLVKPDDTFKNLIKELTDTKSSYAQLSTDIVKNTAALEQAFSKLASQLDEASDAYANALKNLSSQAAEMKVTLQGANVATESGRKTIRAAASDADRLAKSQKELDFQYSEAAKQLAELNALRQEQATINKLIVRLNNSAEGSYDRLSAQYSLNKITLNGMSIEEREATDAGRELVEETNAIYEEMKRLQAETGKTGLNVGNYSDAAKGLTAQIENQTKQLALWRTEGKQGTEEYRRLAQSTAELRDAMRDAQAEVNNLASDTSTLNSVLGAASAASGGFSAVVGAMELFGIESKNVQEAQKTLQAAIAVTTGLQAVQNALQSQSAVMLGISRIQTAALTKAETYRRLVQIQGTKATQGAIIAQKAFNLVASANPYVLLAVALVTVVGALVAFSAASGRAIKNQERLNQLLAAQRAVADENVNQINSVSEAKIRQYNSELTIAKAQGRSLRDQQEIENKIYKEREENLSRLENFRYKEINGLEENRKAAASLLAQLDTLSKYEPTDPAGVFLDGKLVEGRADKLTETVQERLNQTNLSIDVALNLIGQRQDLNADLARQARERLDLQRSMAKRETDILNQAEDERLKLSTDANARRRKETENDYNRRIAAIRVTLAEEENLTLAARRGLENQIQSLTQQKRLALIDLENEFAAERLAIQRRSEDIYLNSLSDGYAKERQILNTSYTREIEDIRNRLNTERTLSVEEREALNQDIVNLQIEQQRELENLVTQNRINQMQAEEERIQMRLESVRQGSEEEINLTRQLLEQQRQIAIQQNKLLSEDLRKDEAEINAYYDDKIVKTTANMAQERALVLFDAQQALAQSEFDLMENSERKKDVFRLNAEKARLQQILKLNETAAEKLSDIEVKTIQNTIDKITKDVDKAKRPRDLFDVFGLNLSDEQKEAINTSISFAIEQLNSYLDARLQIAEQIVQASQKEIDSAQQRLNYELEARAQGYASNVAAAQQELNLARRTQQQALREQERLQKAQQRIQAAQQVSSLITASALIWSQLGFPFAIPAIAVMWGSFAAAQIKANELTRTENSESYGDGTVELLQGGSHASGNDIDLGRKKDGTRRRAEGGEFFAVINKRNSRRYRGIIPDVINSLNSGQFEQKYLNSYKEGSAYNLNINNSIDTGKLEKDVSAIRKHGERQIYTQPDGTRVEIYKNVIKRIRR